MRIAVAGATGLVGTALVTRLKQDGHFVAALVRSKNSPSEIEIPWNPAKGELDPGALDGFDAIVCLSGENISSGRWTESKKRAIHDSRVQTAGLLSESAAQLDNPPKVMVSASAMGYYGNDRGADILTEESTAGDTYLARVCIDWENATQPAKDKGIRVVHPRFGAILSPEGGALDKMITPFKLGLGGVLGSGKQYFSWITLDDAVEVVVAALESEDIVGPVNAVSPEPVTNREFTKTLGRVLSRPTPFPVPAFALRLAMGEMADALLLASLRLRPKLLEEHGFAFHHPRLEEGLKALLD